MTKGSNIVLKLFLIELFRRQCRTTRIGFAFLSSHHTISASCGWVLQRTALINIRCQRNLPREPEVLLLQWLTDTSGTEDAFVSSISWFRMTKIKLWVLEQKAVTKMKWIFTIDQVRFATVHILKQVLMVEFASIPFSRIGASSRHHRSPTCQRGTSHGMVVTWSFALPSSNDYVFCFTFS